MNCNAFTLSKVSVLSLAKPAGPRFEYCDASSTDQRTPRAAAFSSVCRAAAVSPRPSISQLIFQLYPTGDVGAREMYWFA